MTLVMHDDLERLIQRFLDGELTRSERRQLLELLADEPDLRERLVADETMLDDAASLPRPTPAADFVARIVTRLPEQDEAEDMVRLKPDTTKKGLGRGLAAAAAVVLLSVGFLAGRNSTSPSTPPEQATGTVQEHSAVLVQLVLLQPDAQSVVGVGDFNGWVAVRSPLQKRENGVWGTTLTLPPGRYNYQFLIDGTEWVADPLAGETSSDGFGAKNSVLDVEA